MPGRQLDPIVRELLDEAAAKLKLAHEMSLVLESGKAMTDYLHIQHAIAVYQHDLEERAA